MGVSKTSDHIKIKIKMPNPSQEPLASSKVPNEDLKDMDVLYTFKIKIESQNWILEDIDVLCTLKSIWMATILIIGVYKNSDHIPIKIFISNPSQDLLILLEIKCINWNHTFLTWQSSLVLSEQIKTFAEWNSS